MEESFQFMFEDYGESHDKKQSLPWLCPVCHLGFKWDVQLLRHQRKTGHQNPDRLLRKIKKANKKQFKECGYCRERFTDQLQRLSHYPWCEKNPNNCLGPYFSSSEHSKFECNKHQITLYFTKASTLRQHLRTHRNKQKKDQQRDNQGEKKRKRGHVGTRQKIILRRQCSKIRILKKKRAGQIAQSLNMELLLCLLLLNFCKWHTNLSAQPQPHIFRSSGNDCRAAPLSISSFTSKLSKQDGLYLDISRLFYFALSFTLSGSLSNLFSAVPYSPPQFPLEELLSDPFSVPSY